MYSIARVVYRIVYNKVWCRFIAEQYITTIYHCSSNIAIINIITATVYFRKGCLLVHSLINHNLASQSTQHHATMTRKRRHQSNNNSGKYLKTEYSTYYIQPNTKKSTVYYTYHIFAGKKLSLIVTFSVVGLPASAIFNLNSAIASGKTRSAILLSSARV